MRFLLVSCVYNEEDFLPEFLENWDWVDEMCFLVDRKTDDGTRELIQDHNCYEIHFPEGFDDDIKSLYLRLTYKSVSADEFDAVIFADADELLWPKRKARMVLTDLLQEHPVITAPWVQVVDKGQVGLFDPINPTKVLAVRSGLMDFQMSVGNHKVINRPDCRTSELIIAHTPLNDPERAVKRRVGRTKLLSESAKRQGYCFHWRDTDTEEKVYEEISRIKTEGVSLEAYI